MAKNAPTGSMPVDVPAELEPGLTHRMSDFFADESRDRGIYAGFPTSPISARKGNHSAQFGAAPAALTGPGPFKNLRGGR